MAENIFERLRKSAAKLKQISDVANTALEKTEKELLENCVGITVSVPIGANKELAFSRFENKGFRLLVGDKESGIPWQEASREHKILAASKLEELVGLIQAEVDRLLKLVPDQESYPNV